MTELKRRKLRAGEYEHGLHDPDTSNNLGGKASHILYDKDTNEPVMSLKKSSYSNEYTSALHPDFMTAHKSVLLPHETNNRHFRHSAHPDKIDYYGRSLHRKVYNRYYKPYTKYEHAGSEEETVDGKPRNVHTYHIKDEDGDHIMTVKSHHGPDAIGVKSPVTATDHPGIGPDKKYDHDAHYKPGVISVGAKVNTLDHALNLTDHMHSNKDAKAPRFMGHKTATGNASSSKSFKTKLKTGEAIPAYLEHIKNKFPGGTVQSQSDHHAEYATDGATHHLIHSGDLLHHTTLDTGKYTSGNGRNSQIVEST